MWYLWLEKYKMNSSRRLRKKINSIWIIYSLVTRVTFLRVTSNSGRLPISLAQCSKGVKNVLWVLPLRPKLKRITYYSEIKSVYFNARIHGDSNQKLLIQMAITLKICISDPMLVKLFIFENCKQTAENQNKLTPPKHFTNIGSEMHIFRVIAKTNFKFWFAAPCMNAV